MVIHAGPDDYKTDPSGNSGAGSPARCWAAPRPARWRERKRRRMRRATLQRTRPPRPPTMLPKMPPLTKPRRRRRPIATKAFPNPGSPEGTGTEAKLPAPVQGGKRLTSMDQEQIIAVGLLNSPRPRPARTDILARLAGGGRPGLWRSLASDRHGRRGAQPPRQQRPKRSGLARPWQPAGAVERRGREWPSRLAGRWIERIGKSAPIEQSRSYAGALSRA